MFLILCFLRLCFAHLQPLTSAFFVFLRKNLDLTTPITKYMTSASQWFLKNKDVADILCQVNFDSSKLFIKCNTDSCCVPMSGGANICLKYVCVSLPIPMHLGSFCVYTCTRVCVCVFFKLVVNLSPCCIN